MKSKLLNFFSELRASYWYIPLLMCVVSLLLSILTLRLDYLFDWNWLERWGWFHASNPEGARTILSSIATSMITVAGVTFSMTIVAVAFAGSQIGPRLTTNFMRDRANQITLGTFIATFLFCLFILLALFNANKNDIPQADELVFIPQISLLVAIILTLSSILVLIYFIHHIPESINMSNVIAQVGEELNRQINSQFPMNIGNENANLSINLTQNTLKKTTVVAPNQGYIRILDGNSLIDIATKNDLIIQLEARPGDYITEDSTLLVIYSSQTIDDFICKQCIDAFALGHKRNQEQDPLFLVDEMVEIIARALSPGINDPFTAMNCLDWLQSSIQKLSKINQPSAYRCDTKNKLRLITKPITFPEFCDLVFNRVQPYVCRDRNTTFHMMKMIVSIHKNITNQQHKIILISYATSLKDVANKSLSIEEDHKKLLSLYEQYFLN
ncbi:MULTISPECIES: DUF2254 domain-containing protein [Legionella]|uniref:DUF2254 domain-containing protein n=1 Tax=Legionella resiliens TaxID=2905958 RepID=A0ABS8X8S4_9GAMM|nr:MULTISPECIES: DUF2254 domain-containing protein [unclassified Legionella]MCE0724425.1 DUF2254 domain-containing protein [Legionella sp. 9fVS26]MCE3533577.1 DUF2254 domain-containing protein [Legionella sp. 8cVS16]QLZ69767.1 hypothetical protein FOLKNPGA_02565 [Legionella sp. PC1000]